MHESVSGGWRWGWQGATAAGEEVQRCLALASEQGLSWGSMTTAPPLRAAGMVPYAHRYTRVPARTHTHLYTELQSHSHTHTVLTYYSTCAYTHTQAHTHTVTFVHTVHTYNHACTLQHTHTKLPHMHKHTHARTHAPL